MSADLRTAPNAVALLRRWALTRPDQDAVVYVDDPARPDSAVRLSYARLDAHARQIAGRLQRRLAPGDRALLVCPDGWQFPVALLGCLYAGVVAVPAPLPERYRQDQRRVLGIAGSAGVSAVLTDAASLAAVSGWVTANIPGTWCWATDAADQGGAGEPDAPGWTRPALDHDSVALLQYTSGSTGQPKGVVVGHGNLLHNVHSICTAFDLGTGTRAGGWIPLFHDMGLMGLLLPALFVGGTCVLMSPTTFLKRPHQWLGMVDTFDVSFSAAPNFGYEWCCRRVTDEQVARLDLARWRHACNGSEPVRAATMAAFTKKFAPAGLRSDAVVPCFGMAEATVFVSARPEGEPVVRRVDADALTRHELRPGQPGRPVQELVSCGVGYDLQIRVVDPDTRRVLPDGRVGEVWLRGPSVARGYWRDETATAETFQASTADGDGGFLRTGDLGAVYGGELYVTGRSKEMLVIHGRNLYPQDIESEVRAQHPELAGALGAAVGVSLAEEDVLVILHEVRGRWAAPQLRELAAGVAQTVAREFGTRVAGVVLLRPGAVRRTTSGKVQRTAMRELFLADAVDPLYSSLDPRLGGELAGRRGEQQGQRPPSAADRDPDPVAELDRVIDGEQRDGGAFCAADLADLDAGERFPAAACRLLDDFGLPAFYVPTRYGGRLVDFAELVQLVRTVARRDLTVAVAHGKTFLGAACVWLAGAPEQAARLARWVAGGAVVAWGLTERDHGSDLLAGELTAEPAAGRWRLDGEKWLINNATRGRLCCVLARTDPAGGPRGFSLLLVDKEQLAAGAVECLPKVRTHGVRGADISGLRFHRAELPESALVGKVGDGLETVLKALQLTRTVSVGLSLGAADHALRLAAGFAADRPRHGGTLIDLPRVRRLLGEAAAKLLLAEATAVVAARGVCALPAEMSVVSAVAKAFVPTVVQRLIDEVAELVGLRGFLHTGYAHGQFAKLARDHRLVGIFDGSTAVNRSALIDQFPRLARTYRDGRWDETGVLRAVTLATPPPAFDPAGLRLLSAAGCSLLTGGHQAAEQVRDRAARGQAPEWLDRLVAALEAATTRLHHGLARQPYAPREAPAADYDLAAEYELCFAGAACVRLWLANAPLSGDSTWLRACLATVLTGLGEAVAEADREACDELAGRLSTVDRPGYLRLARREGGAR